MLVHALVASGAVAFVVIVAAPAPSLLLWWCLRRIALLRLRKAAKARHHSYLLLQLLYLPHRFHRVETAGAKVRHVDMGRGRLESRRIHAETGLSRVVPIVQVLRGLRTVRIHVAPAPATASGLLKCPSTALEIVTAIGRIEVATILEASLVSTGCRTGRIVGLLARDGAGFWDTEEGRDRSRVLRLGWRRAAWEVAPGLDGLDDLRREAFCVCRKIKLACAPCHRRPMKPPATYHPLGMG